MARPVDLVIDDTGAPALALAGATIVDPDAKSGNPHHEVGSGRFGYGPGKTNRRRTQDRRAMTAPPAQVDSVQRRRDAVIDAARTLDDLSPTGVATFVRKRWSGTKVLTDADIQAFSNDALAQRLQDITDSLDYRVRKAVYGRGGAKVVKIEFPRGLARSTLRGLDNNQIATVLTRLRARGWSSDQLRRHIVRPFDDKDKRMAAELKALT
jgi:hypothetical protein